MNMEYYINELFNTEVTYVSAALKLLISFVLGAIVGIERQQRRQSAGMRTIMLICLGSTVAVLLSIWIPQSYPHMQGGDPGRIAAQILTGIGFLGAGSIIQSKGNVRGLTTAACIWVIAIIGMCVGAGLYVPAVLLTFGTLFVLVALERIEKKRLLSGEVKQLVITFDTADPDIDRVMDTAAEYLLFVFNVSTESDYSAGKSTLTLRVQVREKDTLKRLFFDLRACCPEIARIGIYDV